MRVYAGPGRCSSSTSAGGPSHRGVVPHQGLDPLGLHRLVAAHPSVGDGLHGDLADHADVRLPWQIWR